MRKMKRSIAYNFIMNIVLTMSSFIFPLITFPYVSRVLSPDGIGKVSFATSVVNYFLIIAQLGIPTYGIRACAKVRDKKEELSQVVQEILVINLIMCILAYILLGISVLLVTKLREEWELLLIISVMILFSTIGVEWLYKALEMYAYITWRSILFKVIALVAMFFFVQSKEDYLLYGAITILASSVSNVFNFIYLHKIVDFKFDYSLNLHKHMKPILIFFAMSCATTIYLNLDTVMLGFMKTDADVGYYNAAVKIKTMLVSIVTSLGTVLLPRVTYYIQNKEDEKFYVIGKKAVQFVIFASIPMISFFIVNAECGIVLLSGNEYLAAVLPMKIMMPTLFFIGLTNIMGIQILVPLGKESKVLLSVVAGAVVDLILNALLIPKYASIGAAIGTMVAEIVVFIWQYMTDKELFCKMFSENNLLKTIVATGIASLSLGMVENLEMNEFFTLLLSGCFFGIVYLVSLIVLKEKFTMDIVGKVLEKYKITRRSE